MPRIYYEASNFVGNYSNMNTVLESYIRCRKLNLYHAMITVGNPSYFTLKDVKANGLMRTIANSIVKKVNLVYTYIESNQNGMSLHPIYDGQVSDEKRIVSYNLGMAFAKFYASELFDIPNLIHVETLKQQDSIIINNTLNSREPDLVGRDINGNWHVFEAKGTSSNSLTKPLRDAKEQASNVSSIHGVTPATLTACATSFTQNKIYTKIEDPESKKNKDIELDINKYYESYYNSFFAFKKELKKQKINNIEYNSFDLKLKGLNLSIGLENEVYELLNQKNYNYLDEYYTKLKNIKNEISINRELDDRLVLAKDGFIVKYKDFS